MKRRPWLIMIIGVLHILAPALNAIYVCTRHHISFADLNNVLWLNRGWTGLAETWALLPLAGFAMIAIKEWSYPILLALISAATYESYSTWKHDPANFTLPMLQAFLVLNIGLVGYFMLPKVRALYFNKKLRWWESRPRYYINSPGELVISRNKQTCVVKNISEGGLLVSTESALNPGDKVAVQFPMLGQTLKLKGAVVYTRPGAEGALNGVKFISAIADVRMLRKIIRGLKLMGVECSREDGAWSDLRRWAARLIKTGKGLVPEIQLPAAKVARDPEPTLTLRPQERRSRGRTRNDNRAYEKKRA